jgi:NhaA family Na+:H+ antiporter
MPSRDAVPADRLLAPFRAFASSSASSGVALLAAAAVALVLANSPLAEATAAFWHTDLSIGVGEFERSDTLVHWVNDGLMALFFLVVGLEIKRELLVGELSSRRSAALPIVAAVGGAVVPAAIFLVLVQGQPAARGWGIPMATDIAFALGILALAGSRVPIGLRIFVAALAIVDDLLAVLVIAVFYTAEISVPAVLLAGLLVVALLGANRLGVRRPLVYGALGVVLWLAVLESGVHATVAWVLLALTIPSTTRLDSDEFVARARGHIADFEGRTVGGEDASTEDHHHALWELEDATERAQAPMLRIEHALQPWVVWLVMPIFALANAGVRIPPDVFATILEPLPVGIILGLVIGKQVGISLGALVAVRLGLASLPNGVSWRHVYGAALLGGIGFTMSLFISTLAYGEGSPEIAMAKFGVLVASAIAGVAGYLVLRSLPRMPP